MQKHSFAKRSLGALVAGGLLVAGAAPSLAEDPLFEVTVTNLTHGQPLTPIVIVTHNADTSLFKVGEPISDGLSLVAEDGVTGPGLPPGFPDDGRDTIFDELEANPDVADFVIVEHPTNVPPVILPGESVTAVISSRGRARLLSVVTMLPITNDALAAVSNLRLPRGSREVGARGPAYDGGSEANNEDCAFIPGPPCNNPGVRDTAGAEGFAHIHSGIHGIGDLEPADVEWHNPVIEVRVRRISDDDDD